MARQEKILRKSVQKLLKRGFQNNEILQMVKSELSTELKVEESKKVHTDNSESNEENKVMFCLSNVWINLICIICI